MIYRDTRERDAAHILGVSVVYLVIFLAWIWLSGCCSAPPCICPEPELPPAIDLPVYHPPQSIPAPTPPVLSIYGVDPCDTEAAIEAIVADWHELMRAWLEAYHAIRAHNAVVGPPGGPVTDHTE